MRICLHTIREIAPSFIGGTERLLVELAKELTHLGHEPFLLSSGLRDELQIEGIPLVQKVPDSYKRPYMKYGMANSAFITSEVMGGEASDAGLRALGEYVDAQLKDIDADVIHLNSFASCLYSVAVHGAVVTNHENEREYDSKWGGGFTNLMADAVLGRRCNIHNAALLTTPSQYYAKWYSDAFNLRVTAIKAGVSLTTFSRHQRRTSNKKPKRSSKLQVLLPARFDPFQKGHDIAMRALRILLDTGTSAQLVFSGVRDDYKDRLGRFFDAARSYGVADHVEAKQFVDIHTAYDECDVVVSPERYCSYGLAISEALALGVPTVLSDIPTYKEIASGYEHAKFFSSEDPESFARQILKALELEQSVADREAIRFRIENDLRRTALELHNYYLQIYPK